MVVSQRSPQIRRIKTKKCVGRLILRCNTDKTKQKDSRKNVQERETRGNYNNTCGAQDPRIRHFIFVLAGNGPKSAHKPQNKVYYRYGNTRHVKLKSTTIENLLSFENSEFNFKEYNVIVGPNNSGKTNLLRILKLLASENLSIFGITQQMRLRQGKESQIKLTIETTDQEIKMLLQVLLNKHIDSEEIPDSWKRLTIILNWPALGNNLTPNNVILYFQNKVAVIANFGEHIIFYCPFT